MRYRSATMAPGANRPPLIGSEVTNIGLLLAEATRGREGGLTGRGVDCRAGGRSGARVSRFASPGKSPSTVAFGSLSPSTRLPHCAQNRAVSETDAPQEVQNMGAGFYHLGSSVLKWRSTRAGLPLRDRRPLHERFLSVTAIAKPVAHLLSTGQGSAKGVP